MRNIRLQHIYAYSDLQLALEFATIRTMLVKCTKILLKIVMLGIFCCFVGILSSCAPQFPEYNKVVSSIPPLQPGYARVYLYCAQPSLVWCFTFFIDGKKVGNVLNYHCLYVDHPAGNCEVKANTMYFNPLAGSDLLKLNLLAGETRYIQVEMQQNVTAFTSKSRLIITDSDQAVLDLKKCYYVGKSVPTDPNKRL